MKVKGSILLINSDLKIDNLVLTSKILSELGEMVGEIILHYAYEVPKLPLRGQKLIELHDDLKNSARKKLHSEARKIEQNYSLKTDVILSMGKAYNTVKRLLMEDDRVRWISGRLENRELFNRIARRLFPDQKFDFLEHKDGLYLIELEKVKMEDVLRFMMIMTKIDKELSSDSSGG